MTNDPKLFVIQDMFDRDTFHLYEKRISGGKTHWYHISALFVDLIDTIFPGWKNRAIKDYSHDPLEIKLNCLFPSITEDEEELLRASTGDWKETNNDE